MDQNTITRAPLAYKITLRVSMLSSIREATYQCRRFAGIPINDTGGTETSSKRGTWDGYGEWGDGGKKQDARKSPKSVPSFLRHRGGAYTKRDWSSNKVQTLMAGGEEAPGMSCKAVCFLSSQASYIMTRRYVYRSVPAQAR